MQTQKKKKNTNETSKLKKNKEMWITSCNGFFSPSDFLHFEKLIDINVQVSFKACVVNEKPVVKALYVKS